MEALKSFIARTLQSFTEGWRELLGRSSGALTHFRTDSALTGESSNPFPSWSLLAAEIWETAQSVVVRMEIPGMNQADLATDLHENVLRIRGERHSGAAQQRGRYHLMERAYGRFERRIPLPHSVDPERAEMSYRDGVLTVILPKTEIAPPH